MRNLEDHEAMGPFDTDTVKPRAIEMPDISEKIMDREDRIIALQAAAQVCAGSGRPITSRPDAELLQVVKAAYGFLKGEN